MPKVVRGPTVIAAPQMRGGKLKFATKAIKAGQSGMKQANDGGKMSKDKKAGKQSGMVFDKGHGQHILRNPLVIQAIIEKSGIKTTDVVMEIGPGTGNLTEKLMQCCKKVIAFEIDPRMVSELHKRFQNHPLKSRLEVIKGNCLDFEFPYFDKCVANVPYAISSALVFKLLKKPDFKCAVLMFQREFAMRVCAPPGSDIYCRLSVNSQLLARCSHLIKVSKNSFTPPPKVESSVIRLDPKHPPPPVDFDEWDGLVKLIFNRKNKKMTSIFKTKATYKHLHAIYASYAKLGKCKEIDADGFKALLNVCLEDEMLARRSRTMDLEDIMTVLNTFNRQGIHFA
jgi:18S rRNA (adenine1779-N6/adenine1780-N6)-dimethyltransferase